MSTDRGVSFRYSAPSSRWRRFPCQGGRQIPRSPTDDDLRMMGVSERLIARLADMDPHVRYEVYEQAVTTLMRAPSTC